MDHTVGRNIISIELFANTITMHIKNAMRDSVNIHWRHFYKDKIWSAAL